MAKQVELKLVAEKKVFLNKETGENIEYVSLHTILDGQMIKLSVSKESKQLFNYLIKDKV